MPLPHVTITPIPTVPKPAAVPSLWNERYVEINENFEYVILQIEAAQSGLAGKQDGAAILTALSGLATSADKLIYATGPDTLALTAFTAFGRSLVAAADQAAGRTSLGAAALASPTFTGTPAGPTAAADTSTTQFATTAYVIGQAATAAPQALGAAAVGTSKKYAREDHVHPSAAPLLNNIAGADGTVTINNAAHDIIWNWALTAAGDIGYTVGESTASTGGAGSQDLYKIKTLAGSTANPLRVQARAVDTVLVSRLGAITLSALNGTSGGGTVGSAITVSAGQGATTSAGGTIDITSGAGGATSGASGAVTIASGITTSGISGNVSVKVGDSGGANRAGVLTLQGGSSGAAQSGNSGGVVVVGGDGAAAAVVGGPVVITGGQGGSTAMGGVINITSGAGGATSGASGAINIATGAPAAGPGGAINITASRGYGTGNVGGSVVIAAGMGSATSATTVGGSVTISGGDSMGSGNAIAGAVNINGGTGTGANTAPGAVNITAGSCSTTNGADIVLTAGTGTSNGAINLVNCNVANGTVACVFTANVGPTGANVNIQGWERVKINGTVRYRPYW